MVDHHVELMTLNDEFRTAEEASPLLRRPEIPAPKPYRWRALSGVVVLSLLALSAAPVWKPASSAHLAADSSSAAEELRVSGAYERARGKKPLGDGLVPRLAQVFKPTQLELASGKRVHWFVESAPGQGDEVQLTARDQPAAAVEHTFTAVGKHTVVAREVGADGVTLTGAAHSFTANAKVVRYDLRDLSESDRAVYFEALHAFYVTSQTEGEKLYGATYKSIFVLVKIHIYGAADQSCDHWHDDAGILTHHVGITWAFENSLRSINPATAAHYWDYSREEYEGLEWYQSPVFNDQWFGTNAPSNKDHVVDTGRFAYTPVMADAREFSSITNPYGLLRTPWNTSPVPYVMRNNETFFHFADDYSAFPSCSDFATYLGSDFATVSEAVDGVLHGPVHIMIGGHWDSAFDWKKLGQNFMNSETFILLSKVMWREGFARHPEYCSADTPHSECMPTCPASIISPNGEEVTDDYAHGILDKVNVFKLTPGSDDGEDVTAFWLKLFELYGDGELGFKEMLQEICHMGTPGEMLTSAAPQDPLFWPVHGNSERFVQYLRVLKEEKVVDFDETWGYVFTTGAPGNTGRVCDWSNVDVITDMPNCTFATCPGHKADDLMPFTHLYPEQGEKLLSNAEFYAMISPYNEDLPYVYDSMSTWKGCPEESLLVEAGLVPASASKVKSTKK